MSDVHEHLERLIVRGLDNVLSEDERLALDRELIRNPQARRLMAEYREVDELSAAALNQVVDGEGAKLNGLMPAGAVSFKRRAWYGRTWFWLAPGAVAAALLAVAFSRWSPIGVERPTIVQGPAQTLNSFGGAPQDLMQAVRSTPAIHRNTGREIIGVVGDDGNMYWIEVERTRTVKLPAESPSRASSLNNL